MRKTFFMIYLDTVLFCFHYITHICVCRVCLRCNIIVQSWISCNRAMSFVLHDVPLCTSYPIDMNYLVYLLLVSQSNWCFRIEYTWSSLVSNYRGTKWSWSWRYWLIFSFSQILFPVLLVKKLIELEDGTRWLTIKVQNTLFQDNIWVTSWIFNICNVSLSLLDTGRD